MKPLAAGLLAAGLLVQDGRAEPIAVRPDGIRIGAEVLVPLAGETAMRDRVAGWQIGGAENVRAEGGGAGPHSVPPTTRHPVLALAGAEPSELTRRIVTGLLSVRLREDVTDAEGAAAQLASLHGLTDEGVAEGAAPWRLFRAEPPGRALEIIGALRAGPWVAEAEVVLARRVARRGLPNDELVPYQWHIDNFIPAHDGGAPVDLGVEAVWGEFEAPTAGWRGRGVRLGIIDDGIDYGHPEFADGRLDKAAGRNWNNGSPVNAEAQTPSDAHGTAVAGLAAASANNGIGVAGVAPAAGLVSLRLTAGAHDDAEEAQAIAHLANPRTGAGAAGLIHVKNASWGPADGAFRLGGPGPLARQALATATRDGRGGRGTVFVWSAGNGGALGEDANADGYANNPHVIAVGAMDSSGRVAGYSEGGACVAVVAPSESGTGLPVATTDRPGRHGFNPPTFGTDLPDESFTLGFGGTSAAAPLVAGVCALLLEANPALGWRDVKEILMRTARRVEPDSDDWFSNAVGLRFHPRQGAGLVDAAAAVALAEGWVPLGPATEVRATVSQSAAIPDNNELGVVRSFTIGQRRRVEHALLRLTAAHPFRGDLRVTLTSPGGTESVLAPSYFTSSPSGQANYDQWVFSSVHFWGENASGAWELRVADVLPEETGRFISAELTLMTGEAPAVPVFTSPAARTAAMGEAFHHAVTVNPGPVALSVAGSLPPGLVFDAATGTLRGQPTRAGSFILSFKATAAGGSANQSFELKVLTPYEGWVAAHAVPAQTTGPEADPDGDARPNLLEYAAGGDPMRPDVAEIAHCLAAPDRVPTVTFARRAGRGDLLWQVEHSVDAARWTAIAESRRGQPAVSLAAERFVVAEKEQPDGSRLVEVTPAAAGAHGWFRLRAELEP